MTWRVPSLGAYWSEHKGKPNKMTFRKLVRAGKALGCLAFDAAEPVGWCSYGARSDFAYLRRSRTIAPTDLPSVWSITCFFIKPQHRNLGISELLIREACVDAKRRGALYMEGYPTTPSSNPAPVAFIHTGVPGPFARLGFQVVDSAGARTLVRKKL